MPFCTRCGFQNDFDARYCNGCGRDLEADQNSEPIAKRNRRRRSILLFLLLFFLLVGISTGLLLTGISIEPGPNSVAKQKSVEDNASVVPPTIDKPRDIGKKISKIQKAAKETAGKVFGSDQDVRPLEPPPAPLPEGLKEVELPRNYAYTPEDCNRLFTDVAQQAAGAMETELAGATAISAEEENLLGRQLHESHKQKYRGKMDTYGGWVEYVRSIGESLIKRTARKGIDYHFHVIHGPEENAFALPGGGIYIYTGLLQSLENEAQLANVLAHEIMHVDLRHCIALYQVLRQFPGPAITPALLVAEFARHAYSARREAEADRRGLELAYVFGYSPYQVVRYWQERTTPSDDPSKSDRQGPLSGNIVSSVVNEIDNVLKTHPNNRKRSCLLKNHVIKLEKAYPLERVYVGQWNYENRISMFQQRR